jgi:hypothetical protein
MSSCAKDLHVNYQSDNLNTGTLILKPVSSTEKTFVTINGNLIVENKNVKSVVIENIPKGEYDLHYTSESSWYKNKLDVKVQLQLEKDKTYTQLIEVPPYSTGYWIYVSVLGILPWFLFLI